MENIMEKLRNAGNKLWPHIYSLKPGFISRNPHFNFMTVHYFWIIGMALIGSIMMFPKGNMAYIDSLFFASGAATQSGLNTIDVNLLDTRQQFLLYISCMICNPIVINTFVVFLRLYWFEKRFQHVVQEARRTRRSISKSFSKSKTTDQDIDAVERGVDGRSIVVMHGNTRRDINGNPVEIDGTKDSQTHDKKQQDESSGSSALTAVDEKMEPAPSQIQFADRVKRSNGMSDDILRLPAQRDHHEHIAFYESQRNSDQGEVLRIPGPREMDAGVIPQTIERTGMRRKLSRAASGFSSRRSSIVDDTAIDDQSVDHGDIEATEPKRRITIAEPAHPRGKDTKDEAKKDIQAAAAAAATPLRFRRPRCFTGDKTHAEDDPLNRIRSRSRARTLKTLKSVLSTDKMEGTTYLSWEPTIGRNSAFVNLTEEQREELGGIEYRALKTLAMILVAYFLGFSLFALICLLPWILRDHHYGSVVTSVGQGRVWWAFFTANTAFNDLGFTLTPDSMISFRDAIWPLLSMSFLIVIGNTGFPVMLRFVIWVTSKYVPKASGFYEELRFLLDHPRRCFTLLFPAKATWWLFAILAGLNGLDLLFFIILDFGKSVVTSLPINIRILDGWFQAVSTRTAGTAVVNIAELHPAIQVSYLVMMYISALPIAISVRRTNVYEERSLGIYESPNAEAEDSGEPSYIGAHARRQLSFDLWYIFLGWFLICCTEGPRLASLDDPGFTMFSVLFEIVSAYGTVGLSMGYPNVNTSFSSQFNTISKLIIIAMQLRGRHRGLPYGLDRAILLPSEHLAEKEAQHRPLSSTTTIPHGSTLQLARSKAKSLEKPQHNLLSNLLHPGPTMPPGVRRERRPSAFSFTSGIQSDTRLENGMDVREAGNMDHQRRSVVSMHSGFDVPHANRRAEAISEHGSREE